MRKLLGVNVVGLRKLCPTCRAGLLRIGGVFCVFLLFASCSSPEPDEKAGKKLLEYPSQLLFRLPAPEGAQLFYREYDACIPGKIAEATALYATDLSKEEICKHYDTLDWEALVNLPHILTLPSYKKEGCHIGVGGEIHRTGITWIFPEGNKRYLQVDIEMEESTSAKTSHFYSMRLGGHGNKRAKKIAMAAGKRLFVIKILDWKIKDIVHAAITPDANGESACAMAGNSLFLHDELTDSGVRIPVLK